jgi:hypothetical protein
MSGIFISYRRSDSAGHTGRLADDLGEALVGQALFRDIEAIEAGEDFVEALARAVGECSAMLVVIGPTWAKVTTADGQRRLHQAGDFVRMEVEAALARDVRVIPVLVGDAQMPDADELPASMAPLLRRNAYSISDRRWKYDVEQLIAILEKIPGVRGRSAGEQPPSPPPASPMPITSPPPTPHASAPAAPSRPVHAASPSVAPKRGMPGWVKLMLGLVAAFIVLGMAGLFMEEPEGAASTASAPAESSAAPSASPTSTEAASATTGIAADVEGLWCNDDGRYFRFILDGEGLQVVAGEKVEESDPAAHLAAPARAGARLVGDVRIDGRGLEAALTDQFNGDADLLQLTLSDDGNTLQGQLGAAPVTLERQ